MLPANLPDPRRTGQLLQSGYVPIRALIVCMDPPYLPIPVQFNPAEIKYSKGGQWNPKPQHEADMPKAIFGGGSAPSLSMTLYFDTSDLPHVDVRMYTEPLLLLTLVNPLVKLSQSESRPTLVKFIWGAFSASATMAFTGYIPKVDLKFTMFLPDGTPIRAEADIEFVAHKSILPFQNPTSRSEARRAWVVVEGQSLDWIAWKEYGDPAHWRHIARENNLLNPRNLRAGQVLRLTPLPEVI